MKAFLTQKGFKAYIPDSNFSKDEFERLSFFQKMFLLSGLQKKFYHKTGIPVGKKFKSIRVTDKCAVN